MFQVDPCAFIIPWLTINFGDIVYVYIFLILYSLNFVCIIRFYFYFYSMAASNKLPHQHDTRYVLGRVLFVSTASFSSLCVFVLVQWTIYLRTWLFSIHHVKHFCAYLPLVTLFLSLSLCFPAQQ